MVGTKGASGVGCFDHFSGFLCCHSRVIYPVPDLASCFRGIGWRQENGTVAFTLYPWCFCLYAFDLFYFNFDTSYNQLDALEIR